MHSMVSNAHVRVHSAAQRTFSLICTSSSEYSLMSLCHNSAQQRDKQRTETYSLDFVVSGIAVISKSCTIGGLYPKLKSEMVIGAT